jgi:hypothetical protein
MANARQGPVSACQRPLVTLLTTVSSKFGAPPVRSAYLKRLF